MFGSQKQQALTYSSLNHEAPTYAVQRVMLPSWSLAGEGT
jgi:hypothetical protein